MYDPYANFQQFQLSNGLETYAYHIPDCPWQKIAFIIHSGSKEDPIGLEGVAHFLEHRISEDSKFGSDKLVKLIQNHGGHANLGNTNYLQSSYGFGMPLNKFNQIFQIFAKMLISNTFTNDLDKERSIILNEHAKKYPQSFSYKLNRQYKEWLYHNHWLARVNTLGTLDNIKSITTSDLQKYYDQHYVPANISIVTVGGLSAQKFEHMLLNSPLGESIPGNRNPFLTPTRAVSKPLNNRRQINLSDYIRYNESSDNTSVTMSLILPGTVQYEILNILTDMVEDTVFKELRRKKAWSYSQEVNLYNHLDIKEIIVSLSEVSINNLPTTERLLSKSLSRLCDNKRLFDKIKNYYIKSFIMTDESVGDISGNVADRIMNNRPIISTQQKIALYESLDFAYLQQLAPYLAPDYQYSYLELP